MKTAYLQHGKGTKGPFCTESVLHKFVKADPNKKTHASFKVLFVSRWRRVFIENQKFYINFQGEKIALVFLQSIGVYKMRYTDKALQEDAKNFSEWLLASGSPYFFKAQHRNGYSAIDLYSFDGGGAQNCLRFIEGGTPRECLQSMRAEYNALYGKPGFNNPPTRKQAKAALSSFIDFNADFFAQSLPHCDALYTWAKLTKYRKPKFANGSTGRYFFFHLSNKVKI